MHSCVKLVTLDIIKYIPQNSKSEKEIYLHHAGTWSYGGIYFRYIHPQWPDLDLGRVVICRCVVEWVSLQTRIFAILDIFHQNILVQRFTGKCNYWWFPKLIFSLQACYCIWFLFVEMKSINTETNFLIKKGSGVVLFEADIERKEKRKYLKLAGIPRLGKVGYIAEISTRNCHISSNWGQVW